MVSLAHFATIVYRTSSHRGHFYVREIFVYYRCTFSLSGRVKLCSDVLQDGAMQETSQAVSARLRLPLLSQ